MPYLDDVLNPYQSLTGDLTPEDTLTGLLSEDGLLQGALAISDVVGVTELTELTDVSITNPLNNDVLTYNDVTEKWENMPAQGGGGGGTSDYEDLDNKPSINSVTLTGNKTTAELNISYDDLDDKPTIPTELDELSDVDTTGVFDGAALIYNDGEWNAMSVPIQMPPPVESLQNVIETSPEYAGQVLKLSHGTPVTKWTNDYVSYNELTDTPTFATVATSGSYDDLTDQPSIPDISIEDLSNGITVNKTSGEWSFNSVVLKKSGNTYALTLSLKGSGNVVNAGSNAFVGTISGTGIPTNAVTSATYISSAGIIYLISGNGDIYVRVIGSNATLASGGTNSVTFVYIQ